MLPVDNWKCNSEAPRKEVRARSSGWEAIVTSTCDSLSQGSQWMEGSRRTAQREPTKVSSWGNPEWVKTPKRSERQEESQERAAAFRKPREAERGTGFSATEGQGGFDN